MKNATDGAAGRSGRAGVGAARADGRELERAMPGEDVELAHAPAGQRRPGMLHWAGLVATWSALLTMGVAFALALLVPRLGGATPHVIETGSLSPALPPGTLVALRPASATEITVGDVITYQRSSRDPTLVTHRVVARGADAAGQPRWRTSGAHHDLNAGWVLPAQLKGERWYSVPHLGHLTSFSTNPQRPVIALLLFATLLGCALVQVRGALRRRRARVVLTLNPHASAADDAAR